MRNAPLVGAMNRTAEPYRREMDQVNGSDAARLLHVAVELDVPGGSPATA